MRGAASSSGAGISSRILNIRVDPWFIISNRINTVARLHNSQGKAAFFHRQDAKGRAVMAKTDLFGCPCRKVHLLHHVFEGSRWNQWRLPGIRGLASGFPEEESGFLNGTEEVLPPLPRRRLTGRGFAKGKPKPAPGNGRLGRLWRDSHSSRMPLCGLLCQDFFWWRLFGV